MGMYTEVMARATITPNAAETIKVFLEGGVLKDRHPFWRTPRASSVFRGSSAYFPEGAEYTLKKNSYYDEYDLSFRSSLKNYDGEAEKFFDWLKDNLAEGERPGRFLGYTLYEEDTMPVMYFARSADEV